jgi:hypothetical protein
MAVSGLCLDGNGEECHTPGCSLWLNRPPERSIRDHPGVTITAAPDAPQQAVREPDPCRDDLKAEQLAEVTADRDGLRKALHAIMLGITEPSPKQVAENALDGRYFDPDTDAGVWNFGARPALAAVPELAARHAAEAGLPSGAAAVLAQAVPEMAAVIAELREVRRRVGKLGALVPLGRDATPGECDALRQEIHGIITGGAS